MKYRGGIGQIEIPPEARHHRPGSLEHPGTCRCGLPPAEEELLGAGTRRPRRRDAAVLPCCRLLGPVAGRNTNGEENAWVRLNTMISRCARIPYLSEAADIRYHLIREVFGVNDDSGQFIVGIFVGALIGAATGVLIAPRKGSETREQVLQQTRKMQQELQAEADSIREEFTSEMKKRAGEALGWSSDLVGKVDEKIKEVEGRLSDMQRQLDEADSETP